MVYRDDKVRLCGASARRQAAKTLVDTSAGVGRVSGVRDLWQLAAAAEPMRRSEEFEEQFVDASDTARQAALLSAKVVRVWEYFRQLLT